VRHDDGESVMKDEKSKTALQSGRRVGVYICHCGGNISDHVDVDEICETAKKTPGVSVARTNMFMCSDPGQELIMEDLRSGAVDRVVVASCAPSLHETTFRSTLQRAGVNPYLYEHANIREQVSWVHHGGKATEKATRLVAAAVAKAGLIEPLDPIRVQALRHVTVIGGGIAGLKTAKDLAELGIEVALVEKSPFLGGRTAQLDILSPTGEKVAGIISELAEGVLSHPSIRVYHCAQVTGFEGCIGNFKIEVTQSPAQSSEDLEKLKKMRRSGKGPQAFIPFVGVMPGEVPGVEKSLIIQTGVVVLTTGFSPYKPRTGEYGFAELEEVVTLQEFLNLMAETEGSGNVLEMNGRKIRSIAMIHCVGSRQIPGVHEEDENGYLNEYCSRTCCSATLHAANEVRKRYPGTYVYELYRDIRAYGRGQEELYGEAARNGVLFMRFEADSPPEVMKSPRPGAFPIHIKVKDTLTFGEEMEIPADLAVLSVGMEPADISGLVEMMKLPVGADRFLLEVHPKLRPVELSVGGILLAGTCQAPMDAGEASAAASAAAVKASALLARGFIELDPFVAEVDLEKCKGTGACVEACLKEGALSLIESEESDGQTVKKAQVTPALCMGCGACVAVCPENAIEVKGWTLKQYEAMVDMIVSGDLAA
jgi:heterodisulfide reductase subunit A2